MRYISKETSIFIKFSYRHKIINLIHPDITVN